MLRRRFQRPLQRVPYRDVTVFSYLVNLFYFKSKKRKTVPLNTKALPLRLPDRLKFTMNHHNFTVIIGKAYL